MKEAISACESSGESDSFTPSGFTLTASDWSFVSLARGRRSLAVKAFRERESFSSDESEVKVEGREVRVLRERKSSRRLLSLEMSSGNELSLFPLKDNFLEEISDISKLNDDLI